MIWQAVASSGFSYVDWVVRKEVYKETPILHIYIEPKKHNITDEREIATSIHEQLKQLNKDYADLERFFGYKPLKVTLLPEGVFGEYMTSQKAAGADLAHLKPPHMNPPDSVMKALQKGKPPAVPASRDISDVKTRS